MKEKVNLIFKLCEENANLPQIHNLNNLIFKKSKILVTKSQDIYPLSNRLNQKIKFPSYNLGKF